MNTISYDTFLDKIHGCWYGKCLGGAAGAPVEGIKKIIEVEDFTEIFDPDLPNDDLDIQLLWLDVLEHKGVQINACDLADAWIEKCWYPFSEYGYFMKNYMRGVKPPYTGIINNSFFKEGMGCPIRSEIWGCIAAGNPKLAADYAYIDGCLDHADNSVYAEQFLAAIEAMAFFEDDIITLVKKGMEFIPKDSRLYRCYDEILNCYTGKTWQEMRQIVLSKYSHPDFTNVVQNLAFVLIALLYGKGDMRDTINIALKCGYDTDCTCASAASVVGIIKGYRGLGEEICSLIKDYFVCGVDVVRPSDSIRGLAEDTLKMALKVPNGMLKVTDSPIEQVSAEPTLKLQLEYPTEEGLKNAYKAIKPVHWTVYGPFFEPLDVPMNPNYPSPHGEGSVLPDLVCMVNSQAFLDREYITDFAKETPICEFDAYEDWIEIDKNMTMEGQMCCYARTTINCPGDRKVWMIVGNNDGFRLTVNGENVLEKDEIRLWTPYNNFTLVDLKKGENQITVKMLRRTESLRLTLGIRCYDGNHWHRSKWCTDLG